MQKKSPPSISKNRIVFFDIRYPDIYNRYFYTLVKFFHLENYTIYIANNNNQFEKIAKGDRYLSRIINEKIARFGIPINKGDAIIFNEDFLSLEYFNFLLNDKQYAEGEFYIPMAQHPSMYHHRFWNLPIPLKTRKQSIFMAGNFEEKSYRNIEMFNFKINSRIEVYKFLDSQNVLTTFLERKSFNNFFKSNSDKKCILLDRTIFEISMENLRNILGQFSFFLALPGYIMPYAHNLVEAMSIGTIPLIQKEYAEIVHPPLQHQVNAIIFTDLPDLLEKMDFAYNLSEDLLTSMKNNVLTYYQKYLTPRAVINQLVSKNHKKIYLQAEQQSVLQFEMQLSLK